MDRYKVKTILFVWIILDDNFEERKETRIAWRETMEWKQKQTKNVEYKMMWEKWFTLARKRKKYTGGEKCTKIE